MRYLLAALLFTLLLPPAFAQEGAAAQALPKPSVLQEEALPQTTTPWEAAAPDTSAAPQTAPAGEPVKEAAPQPKQEPVKKDKDVLPGFVAEYPSLDSFLNMQKELWLKENSKNTASQEEAKQPPNQTIALQPLTLPPAQQDTAPKQASPQKTKQTAKAAANTKTKAQSAATPAAQPAAQASPVIITQAQQPAEPPQNQKHNWLRFALGILYMLALGTGVYFLSKYQ